MYTKLQMVLAARVFAIENGVDKSTHSVHIFNVFSPRNEQALRNETTSLHSQVEQDVGRKRNDCHKLTIWVRVYGPEIFAGAAKAVPATDSADCFWAFDFAVRFPALRLLTSLCRVRRAHKILVTGCVPHLQTLRSFCQ